MFTKRTIENLTCYFSDKYLSLLCGRCARNFFSCFCHPHIILTNFLALLTRNTMGKFNKGDFHDSMKIFTYVHYNKGQSSLMRSERNSTKHGIYISTFFFADTLGKMQNFNISIVLLGPK